MRNAHILLITIRALANEVAKNLVLAGIGSLTVLDPDIVVEDDLGGQFFIGEEHVGMNVCWWCYFTSLSADALVNISIFRERWLLLQLYNG